jgi:hypothetical protein
VDALWEEWKGTEAAKGRNVYAVMVPTKDKWTAILCSRKISVGSLYQSARVQMELPKQAFAVIPIFDIFDRITKKLSELLDES